MPPPITPTYANLATHAWAEIQEEILKKQPGSPILGSLGQAGRRLLEPHFPSDHLSGIKFRAMATVPAPSLPALMARMNYSDINVFRNECNSINSNLFNVIYLFSNGSRFNGIAYNDTIYLKMSMRDELDLILHEVVHTLQWSHLGPETFLSKYISGFCTVFPAYQSNGAEKMAYSCQDYFKKRANGLLPSLVTKLTLQAVKLKLGMNASMDDVVNTLIAIPSLNLNGTKATQFMI